VFITPGKGVAMQYRGSTGASSVQAAQTIGVTAPAFLRLTRRGNTFTGEWSTDLVNWQTLSIIENPDAGGAARRPRRHQPQHVGNGDGGLRRSRSALVAQ
jgi:hypothetical protein